MVKYTKNIDRLDFDFRKKKNSGYRNTGGLDVCNVKCKQN